MLTEFGGLYFDPRDVTDINQGEGVIWINRRGLRGLRVPCDDGAERACAEVAASIINHALAGVVE